MNNGTMLNAYPDSMGGRLSEIVNLLERPEFKDVFRSFYLLPSLFDTDLDRGFSVISYDLNERLAEYKDLERLKRLGIDLKLDFILNHLSVLSKPFQDILQKGDESAYRDFFIDWNRFWQGCGEMTREGYIQPDEAYIKDMFFRKPGLPILMVRFPDGRNVPYWNTFYQEVRYKKPDEQELMKRLGVQYDTAAQIVKRICEQLDKGISPAQMDLKEWPALRGKIEEMLESERRYLGQMDLNVRSPLVWKFYEETLDRLKDYGAGIVRLDAFAYAPKEPGRRNFMNEPDTWELLERIGEMAKERNLELLPEIHASYEEQGYEKIASEGYMTYDFFMPGLIIDAIENHNGDTLLQWADEIQIKGLKVVNMLGCHDGIPLLDLKGLIPEERIQGLIDCVVSRGGLVKNLHGQKNVYYQVNATYYSALGENDQKMLTARALQLFMPGKPQIWYLDLFAGRNDLEAVHAGGGAAHKEINRTNLTIEQMDEALKKEVVYKQLEMLRMRNTCAAFAEGATYEAICTGGDQIKICWKRDHAWARLCVDLTRYNGTIETGGEENPVKMSF